MKVFVKEYVRKLNPNVILQESKREIVDHGVIGSIWSFILKNGFACLFMVDLGYHLNVGY